MTQTDQISPAEARLRQNFAVFEDHVRQAERLLAEGKLDDAAVSASTAAWIATKKHSGLFGSERLERVIHRIAGTIKDLPAPPHERKKDGASVRRILNVATEVFPVGGLTRMISRWIDTDSDREHSVALTRFRYSVPEHLREAVSRSGGQVHILNREAGTLRDWAARLRQIARGYDLVILHIHCEDVVPLLAFSNADDLPPIVMSNHADHIFWLGSSVCNSVLNLRDAAADIAVNRRGIPPERSILLPTPLDPPTRRMTREEARATIGAPDDSVVMISVARGAKYRPIGGKTYADRFVDVLKANPNARLYVVGSGMPEGWQAASDSVGGRIIGVAERPDPWAYFEGADVYVDSYPFSSSTSLMEAAGYGLPLLTLFTAPDEARIVGINHLGLIGGVHQARTETEWLAEIDRMIKDPDYRSERGALAAKSVAAAQPAEWREWLERAYDVSVKLPPMTASFPELGKVTDILHTGEPDIRHEDMYGSEMDVDDFIKDNLGMICLPARLRILGQLRKRGAVSGLAENVRLMVPEWIKRRLKK